jgi:hypothetical protein
VVGNITIDVYIILLPVLRNIVRQHGASLVVREQGVSIMADSMLYIIILIFIIIVFLKKDVLCAGVAGLDLLPVFRLSSDMHTQQSHNVV